MKDKEGLQVRSQEENSSCPKKDHDIHRLEKLSYTQTPLHETPRYDALPPSKNPVRQKNAIKLS
jgi:hypothetical protein